MPCPYAFRCEKKVLRGRRRTHVSHAFEIRYSSSQERIDSAPVAGKNGGESFINRWSYL